LVNVKPSDTIKNVKRLIKNQLKNSKLEFDLATIYPRKHLTNENATLEQNDLTQNSNLMMILKKKL
jgi:hypothetical protein